ncbi:MAG: dihydroneopterin aldolase [Bacteroidetes bacterium]|nr:dihydroneopterin aldolase [Bacteroidota bacterium]
MLFVHLSNLHFYASHGFYEEEKVMGASFEVNVRVGFQPNKFPILHLTETIDYSAVYELVKKVMQHAQPLLETVAGTMAVQIFEQFSLAEQVHIHIVKLNPPILEFMGESGVSLDVKRDEIRN